LNTNSKELLANNKILPLTNQHYELLLKFVKSPGVVYSKDELIDTVWKGRVVTGNTVDQSISKLRKILNTEIKDTYIKNA
jgi:DNA-binding winged helix-turn-helix (wHTH) protein